MINLDNASTTKPFYEVINAISDALNNDYLNMSAKYAQAKMVEKKVSVIRENILNRPNFFIEIEDYVESNTIMEVLSEHNEETFQSAKIYFNDIELYSLLKNKYSQKIVLGNDVNTAAIGFYLTEKNYENVCLLYQPGEGYGGVGTVINGQLITGKTNCAGEIQYLPLSNEDQLKLLQTPHGTIELLSKIVVCLTAIVNPEIVAISCTNLEKASDLDETLESMVPAKYLPKIKKVTNLNDYILVGLQFICKEVLKNNFINKK